MTSPHLPLSVPTGFEAGIWKFTQKYGNHLPMQIRCPDSVITATAELPFFLATVSGFQPEQAWKVVGGGVQGGRVIPLLGRPHCR